MRTNGSKASNALQSGIDDGDGKSNLNGTVDDGIKCTPITQDNEPPVRYEGDDEERPLMSRMPMNFGVWSLKSRARLLARCVGIATIIVLIRVALMYRSPRSPTEFSSASDLEDIRQDTLALQPDSLNDLTKEESLHSLSLMDLPPTDCLSTGREQNPLNDARCGRGYSPVRHGENITVIFHGRTLHAMRHLEWGCKLGRPCLSEPWCSFETFEEVNDTAARGDVVVVAMDDFKDLETIYLMTQRKYMKRILFWQSPQSRYLGIYGQRNGFDVMLGPFLLAGLILANPLKRPDFFFRFVVPPMSESQRNSLAFIISSVCFTDSHREVYLERLMGYLGRERVHRYGRCGTMDLPSPKTAQQLTKLASKYLFYFAFETVVMDSYASEKLFNALALPSLPVYYGERLKFNVTKQPSFLYAQDFGGPKQLASYLLYLSDNPELYQKYHTWRSEGVAGLTSEYLALVSQTLPGPSELHDGMLTQDQAVCCRMCHKSYLSELAARRKSQFLKPALLTGQLDKIFFNGTFNEGLD